MSFEEDYSFDNYKNLSGSVDGDGEIKESYKISKNRKSREEVMNEINKTKIKRNIILYPLGLIIVSAAAYLIYDGIKVNMNLDNLKKTNELVSISPFERSIDKQIEKSANTLSIEEKEEVGVKSSKRVSNEDINNKEELNVYTSTIDNKKEKISIEDKIESKSSISSIEVINVDKEKISINKDNNVNINKNININNKEIKEVDKDILVNLRSKENKEQKEYEIDNSKNEIKEIEVIGVKEVIGLNSINKEIKDNREIKEGNKDLLINLKSKESKNQKDYTINNVNEKEEIVVEKDTSKDLMEYKSKNKNKEIITIRENALNHINSNKVEITLKYFFNSECYSLDGMVYIEKGSFKSEDKKVLGFSNNDKYYFYKNLSGDICKTEKGNIKNESIKVNGTIESDKEEESTFNLIETKNNIKSYGRNHQLPLGVKYKCFITGEDEIRGNTSIVIGVKDGEEIIFIKGEDVCITEGVESFM